MWGCNVQANIAPCPASALAGQGTRYSYSGAQDRMVWDQVHATHHVGVAQFGGLGFVPWTDAGAVESGESTGGTGLWTVENIFCNYIEKQIPSH